MDQKDKEKLLELVICKGEIRSDTFQYSLDEKRDFAEKWGMKELFARHDQLENDIHWSEDTVAERRYEAELNEVRDLIVLQAKECLRKENIDIDKAFDMEQGDEERRKAILSQLSVLGIDENDAVRLGLDNAELLEEKGKSIRMSLPDTPERREVSDEKEKLEYIVQAGRKGIDDIFGTKARDKSRERFLSRYNLSSLYNHKSGDQSDLQTMERLDRRIRDVAELEYNKARLRLRGMKI